MIVALIVICEVGFWVLLAAGLGARYVLRKPRLGVALLLCEPVLEVVLLIATAVDLKNGAEPNWTHGLAALYIGYTVGHGHRTVKWLDGLAARRFDGVEPVQPPKYGKERAVHEGKVWLGTLTGAATATALLLLAIAYVGDGARDDSLWAWIAQAWKITGIHGLVALGYTVFPPRVPAGKDAWGNDLGDLDEGARAPEPTGKRL
ncbi:hypothetical protein [Streptomyces qinzhouensis]|uniref:Uncharacterized protein n=1 Tax=Streptomyces qinzhouensis TaxID=2599401 RepID=A0A5B8IKL8_9ACTN|nr:hypothetical protein [Streptomyces qinzhouensis]QDY79052.1 hypothetical protein FQU76_23865 [Streptomyces qinzhouensis]